MSGRFPRSLQLLAGLALFSSASWALTVTAGCPPDAAEQNTPYTFVITFTDNSGPVTFSLNQALPAGLSLVSPGAISGTPTTNGVFTISVKLSDSVDTENYTCSLTIYPPLTVTTGCPIPSAIVGSPYALQISVTGGQAPYSYNVLGLLPSGSDVPGELPPGLTISPGGLISGTPTTAGNYPLRILIIDNQEQGVEYDCALAVTTFQITAACPAAGGTVGVAYSFAVTVQGTGQFGWSLQQGPLPPGLSLNPSTGVISGTPTAQGSYPFVISVSAVGQPSQVYSCSIVIANPPLTVTSACPINSFPATLTASGGTGNYTFSIAGSLPANLSFSGATIAGQLNAAPGTYPFTIQVADGQTTAQKPCSIVVTTPPLQITSGCPPTLAPQGQPLSFTLTAAGGAGGFQWSIAGTLPPGVTLDGNLLSGTPTGPQQTFPFQIQVTSGAAATSISCALTITPPLLMLTSGCPGNGSAGTAYGPFALTATGGLGAGTYTFSFSGNLPTGVTLTGNTIGGQPTAAGTFNFTLSVDSGQQHVSSPPCSVTIAAANGGLQITAACPTGPFTAGQPVSIAFTVSGGQAPYSFAVAGASWLSVVNQSGMTSLSGTPAANNTGPFNIVLTVTDAAQGTTAFHCSLTVNPAPGTLQILGSCPNAPFTSGTSASISVSATGGTAPYSWSLTGPDWLSLSANQGAQVTVGGSVALEAGTYPFTVTLKDSAGNTPAVLTCTLTVQAPPLNALGFCPPSTLDLPVQLSIRVVAMGGQGPYTWSFEGPSWLGLSSLTGAETNVQTIGTPSSPGSFTFTVTLTDSVKSPLSQLTCTSSINAPAPPAVQLTGLTLQSPLLSTTTDGLSVSPAPLLPITGTVQLSFIPNAFGITDNPQVYFNGGSRMASFTIAPGATSFSLPAVQQGTDAGTIHLEVTALDQGGVSVLTSPHPSLDLIIPRLAPVVGSSDVSFASETSNGFTVVINGYSTPRDMQSVTLTFQPAQGAHLSGTTSFTIDVSSLFSQYYSTAASQLAGSQWQNLQIPITLGGDKTAVGSVSVTMSNSVGSSQQITLSR